jgi:hypothetical protein
LSTSTGPFRAPPRGLSAPLGKTPASTW